MGLKKTFKRATAGISKVVKHSVTGKNTGITKLMDKVPVAKNIWSGTRRVVQKYADNPANLLLDAVAPGLGLAKSTFDAGKGAMADNAADAAASAELEAAGEIAELDRQTEKRRLGEVQKQRQSLLDRSARGGRGLFGGGASFGRSLLG